MPTDQYLPTIRHVRADVFQVQSESDTTTFYEVHLQPQSCTCAHFGFRRAECKHIKFAKDFEDQRRRTELAMKQGQQAELLNKLLEAAPRLVQLSRKAGELSCKVLEKELNAIVGQLSAAVELQRRTLKEESELPFEVI